MRILCATDRLPKSEPAIERAGMLADRLGADLTLLHVVVPGESERALEEELRNAQAQMKSRAQSPLWRGRRLPSVAVRTGNSARLILEAMKDSKARLLVLGPHRQRPLRDALEGTIAEKALAARLCPVLIAQGEARSSYRRVLLALDLSEASAAALRAAEALVLAPQVDAHIVHAYEPPYEGMVRLAGASDESRMSYADGWKHEATRAIRDMLKHESANFARYDIGIEQRHPAGGILHAVEQFQPDLLVMGTRGGGRLHRALLGSVANRVLPEVDCDTLIVPQGSVGKSESRAIARQWQPRSESVRGEVE